MVLFGLFEDEIDLCEELEVYLFMVGYCVFCVDFLVEFFLVGDGLCFDVIIVDCGLFDVDGLQVIEWVCCEFLWIGIVMLIVCGSSEDRIFGLQIGVDYYLVKFVSLLELGVYVLVFLWWLFEGWCLDGNECCLYVFDGMCFVLSVCEFDLFGLIVCCGSCMVSCCEVVEVLGWDWLLFDQCCLDMLVSWLCWCCWEVCGQEFLICIEYFCGYVVIGVIEFI